MLKGIDRRLTAELLHVLMQMGHGDDIVVCDINHPAVTIARHTTHGRLVDMAGCDIPAAAEAILTLMPLDDFVDDPAICMQVVGNADKREPIMDEFEKIVKKHEPKMAITTLERFAFYKRANAGYAIVQTGERRLYGNIVLKKGVIRP